MTWGIGNYWSFLHSCRVTDVYVNISWVRVSMGGKWDRLGKNCQGWQKNTCMEIELIESSTIRIWIRALERCLHRFAYVLAPFEDFKCYRFLSSLPIQCSDRQLLYPPKTWVTKKCTASHSIKPLNQYQRWNEMWYRRTMNPTYFWPG